MTKRRARPSLPVLADVGTVERRQHADYVPAHRDRTGDRPAKALDPLDLLCRRNCITETQRDAGRKFEALYRAQHGSPSVTARYGDMIRGATETDQEWSQRVQSAYLTAVKTVIREAGKLGTSAVIDVCIMGIPCGRERVHIVQASLAALVRVWRM